MNHSEEKEQLHVRPCDGCARRRARWYCAADDAFLCQRCDASVHSANPLARRHERLRLKTSSFSVLKLDTPAWNHGITRKARTPRPKPAGAVVKSEPLVPDLETVSADENNTEEEQLLYCVPVLDHSPVLEKPLFDSDNYVRVHDDDDAELTDFAADMERLLGPGLDEDALCMEGLGFLDLKDESNQIKMEVDEDDEKMVMRELDVDLLSRETNLELNVDCGSLDQSDDQKVNDQCLHGKRLILRLDYEKVMTAWSSCNGLSPWGDGERPVINLDECWPDFIMGGVWGGVRGGGGGEIGQVGGGDGGREARVTRYREKRRTRLFAKKIRYEVRKLNAEKRPRMKGRFVKRVSSY